MIKTIRLLKLHKSTKQDKGGVVRVWLPSNGIYNNSLITVAMSDSNIFEEKLSYQSEKIEIILSHDQSLKRKELAVEN